MLIYQRQDTARRVKEHYAKDSRYPAERCPAPVYTTSPGRRHWCFARLGPTPISRHLAQSLLSLGDGVLPPACGGPVERLQNLRRRTYQPYSRGWGGCGSKASSAYDLSALQPYQQREDCFRGSSTAAHPFWAGGGHQ